MHACVHFIRGCARTMKKGITSSVLSKLRATDSRKERSDRKAASLSSLCNNATIVLIDAYGEHCYQITNIEGSLTKLSMEKRIFLFVSHCEKKWETFYVRNSFLRSRELPELTKLAPVNPIKDITNYKLRLNCESA